MSKVTIGDVVSRLKKKVKAVRQDAFLTDRFVYSIINQHAKWLLKREDGANKLMAFSSVFKTLDFVPLIEIDKIEAGCVGISSGVTFMRTKDKLPIFMQGYWGPLIRSVTSIDGSEDFQPTNPSNYLNISKSKNFRYNKTKYFWFLNDYLYFPNISWPAVRIEAIMEDSIADYVCEECDEELACQQRQLQDFNVPDYLHAEILSHAYKELIEMANLPSDPSANDNQNILR